MRVLGTSIHFELGELVIAESGVGQHAADCFLENSYRLAGAERLQRFGFETTRITGVMAVKLLGFFLAGDFDFLGVDDNDKVATVHVGGEFRLVLSAQNFGDTGGDATEDLSLSIDNVPFPFNFVRLGAVRFHN